VLKIGLERALSLQRALGEFGVTGKAFQRLRRKALEELGVSGNTIKKRSGPKERRSL